MRVSNSGKTCIGATEGQPCPTNKAAVVKGRCRTCQSRARRLSEPRKADTDWLPALPLLGRVMAHGGLAMLTGLSESSAEYDRLRHQIERAEDTGRINVFIADEFCCRWLKVHPCAVWGEDWFTLSEKACSEPVIQSDVAA